MNTKTIFTNITQIFREHFGDKITHDFEVVKRTEGDNPELEFEFDVYRYFTVKFILRERKFKVALASGDYWIDINSSQDDFQTADFDSFADEIMMLIELRIPGKYLEYYEWA
jgi:hypothetical protein